MDYYYSAAGDALLSTSFEHVAEHTPKTVPAERVVEVLRRLGTAVGAYGAHPVAAFVPIGCSYSSFVSA